MMRVAVVVAVACLSVVGLCVGQEVRASIKRSTNIPAQELVPALKTLARERGFQVVFQSEVVGTVRSQGAVGELTTTEALTKLLDGTNLVYSYLDEKTVTITPQEGEASSLRSETGQSLSGMEPVRLAQNESSSGLSPQRSVLSTVPPVPMADSPGKVIDIPAGGLGTALDLLSKQTGTRTVYRPEQVRGLKTRGVHGTFSTEAAAKKLVEGTGLDVSTDSSGAVIIAPQAKTIGASNEDDRVGLEEVIVTATKENEPVRAIAGSVTVLSGPQLDAVGAQSFADYLTRVPGVVFNAAAPGLSTATIRGVSTTTGLDQGQGTTGYFINDVPLTDPNYAVAIPDIDTFDVNNVSVLKGPQGTLFGSASLGGAINYVTAPPNLGKFEGRVQGTVAGASVGAGSQSEKIMLNAPLVEDRLALRGVFVYRDDGGYIDNIGTGVKNSNETLIRGGRLEVLWAPTDGTQINYLFLRQLEDTKDLGYQEEAIAGPLKKNTLIAEPYDFKTTINSLRLDQDVGFASLTATATYHQKAQFSNFDATLGLAGLFNNQLSPISSPNYANSNGTAFEARLASKSGGRFDYLVGIMHDLTRESVLNLFEAPGAQQYATTTYDPIFGAGFGQRVVKGNVAYSSAADFKGEEEALFGEGSFHFNNEWKITLGGRLFDTKVNGLTASSGLLEYLFTDPSVLNFTFASSEKATGFTPKVSITWSPTSDIMAYALASKGFRFGGPNVNPPDPQDPFPPTYAPDTLWNYEIGTRTDWFDGTLELDATVFYIDWSNIQVRLSTDSGLSYGTNFGKATNYGFESTALWRPIGGLTMQGNVTYLDATLSQAVQFGGTNEPAGATLPGASKWNLGATVRYDWSSIPWRPAVQLSDRFISTAPSGFGFAAPVTQGNYNLLDGRASGRYANVEATVFVNNIADKRGVSNSNYYSGSPFEQYIVRPRTYGLTLDYRF
jgi:iron complex outermembrane recepter protein